MTGSTQLLSGWGRNPVSRALLRSPSGVEEIEGLLTAGHRRGVIARGMARSYGDAAQNSGGTVISTRGLDRIVSFDSEAGTIEVEAGVTLDQIMRRTVPAGWWPAVTPGTRQVTVGGAIAANVHGKNHHRDGAFCSHVDSMTLATPAEGILTVNPVDDAEVFWATAGGMGLTGLVLAATLRLIPVETGYVTATHERLDNLDSLMSRMVEVDQTHRYSVAWVDCLARGRSLGRSILEFGDHATLGDLPRRLSAPAVASAFDPTTRLAVPRGLPSGLLNRATIAAFNQAWYMKAPRRARTRLAPLASFFHPLDALSEWNRMYGHRGFLQYQFAVPDEASDAVRKTIEALARGRLAGFLAVLKRFGDADPGPLSFPQPGWTLAVDVPIPGRTSAALTLMSVLDRLDDMVASAGGRLYLAKDSRLRAELLPVMYPELPRWQEIRHRLDPYGVLRSDLARRLGLLSSSTASADSFPGGSSL